MILIPLLLKNNEKNRLFIIFTIDFKSINDKILTVDQQNIVCGEWQDG